MNPGDLCRFLPGYQVEHWECDEHPNGTVTDVRTGEVVTKVRYPSIHRTTEGN